jgi:hypothetical protein
MLPGSSNPRRRAPAPGFSRDNTTPPGMACIVLRRGNTCHQDSLCTWLRRRPTFFQPGKPRMLRPQCESPPRTRTFPGVPRLKCPPPDSWHTQCLTWSCTGPACSDSHRKPCMGAPCMRRLDSSGRLCMQCTRLDQNTPPPHTHSALRYMARTRCQTQSTQSNIPARTCWSCNPDSRIATRTAGSAFHRPCRRRRSTSHEHRNNLSRSPCIPATSGTCMPGTPCTLPIQQAIACNALMRHLIYTAYSARLANFPSRFRTTGTPP